MHEQPDTLMCILPCGLNSNEGCALKIAILSDTHNLLRPEVLRQLEGCGAILHGGDVCRQSILEELGRHAPVFAVRGNNDREWAEHLPLRLETGLGGLRIAMAHRKKDLPADLSGFDLAIYGHTHQYAESRQGRTLLLNPGSCGPVRFLQPVTMALLTVDEAGWRVERVNITPAETEPAVQLTGDVRRQIETVIRLSEKGWPPEKIARRCGIKEALAEQIARLYVTHPGVTVEGIMEKMGL